MGLDRQGGTFLLWQGTHTRFFVVCAGFEVVVAGGCVDLNVTASVFFFEMTQVRNQSYNLYLYLIKK